MSGSDQGVDRLVREDDVARALATREPGQPDIPSRPISDAGVVLGGEIESGLQSASGAVRGGPLEALRDQAVTPMPQLARAEEADRLGRQSRREVLADAAHISHVAAARLQVGLVVVERLADGRRPVVAAVSRRAPTSGHSLALARNRERARRRHLRGRLQ